MSASKCIIILSEKSSGSSACQNLLAKFAEIKYVSKTRHFENETLYWTKAASILGLPQLNMIDSEVPIEREKAKKDLITLLGDNLENYSPPHNNRELIFGGWKLLCEKHTPIFLEKSPHHLYQWAALELIIECMQSVNDTDFHGNPTTNFFLILRTKRLLFYEQSIEEMFTGGFEGVTNGGIVATRFRTLDSYFFCLKAKKRMKQDVPLDRKSFARDLRRRKNDSDFLDCVKEAIEDVELAETTSRITNLKKLKGESGYYRIRFGNYRIGIKIEDDLVIFIRALHRKDIYRYFF